ncbi:hypothetical protein SANTM175S_04254 [Streptomyces antimycoticus]
MLKEQPPDYGFWCLIVALIQLHLDATIWLSSL